MSNNDDLLKKVDIERIAVEGTKIYEQIKYKYDPAHKGKFLAIEIDSKDVYMADTSAAAMEQAREQHPNKVFYIVKIGYDSAESIAKSFLGNY